MMISVVVPVFNSLRISSVAVECLFQCVRYDAWECIIVDDGSIDETFEHFMAKAQEHDNMTVLRRTKAIGQYSNPALARNCGIKAAKGDIIACMDGDILHFTDPVSHTAKAFRDHGNDIISTSGDWCRVVLNAKQNELRVTSRGSAGPLPCGAWLAAHRNSWMQINGYDERFTTYGGEDNDLCARFSRLGLRTILCTGIFAIHPWHKPQYSGQRKDQEQYSKQLDIIRNDKSIQRNVGLEWGVLE